MNPIITVLSDYAALCADVADQIAALVRASPNAVLGLATGSTPFGVYDRLARWHQDDGLDFSNVTCFNLDEYYPMTPDNPHSYHYFMQTHLFGRIHCRRWSVPDGRAGSPEEVAARATAYEAAVADAGGIDFQLLGIGRTGHIGFNEPGSLPDSRTRLVTLSLETREDAAPGFGGLHEVPRRAVSMGIGTILDARRLILIASGPAKAEIVRDALEGPVTARVPASFLQHHPNVCVCLDRGAAAGLKTQPYQ